MTSRLEIGKRVTKTSTNKFGWENIDFIPKDETCVIYLGGNGTTTDREANGNAKIITEEITSYIDEDIPVYSVQYDFNSLTFGKEARKLAVLEKSFKALLSNKKETILALKAQMSFDDFAPKYIDNLYQKVIKDRISTLNGAIRLPLHKALKNIRKVNFVAHCHGAFVAYKLEQKMQTEMENLGYDKKEREAIQSQMLVVAHAPSCPLKGIKSEFISFSSAYDNIQEQPKTPLNFYISAKKMSEQKRLLALQLNDHEAAKKYSVWNFPACYFEKKDGNHFLIKQKFELEETGEVPPEEHFDASYFAIDQTKDGQMMGFLAGNILKSAILNSLEQDENFKPLPPIEDLILTKDEEYDTMIKDIFLKMKNSGKNARYISNQLVLRLRAQQRLEKQI